MKFKKRLAQYFFPARENAYRPHLLSKRWLLAFLGVALVAEGLLIAALLTRQSGADFLAAIIKSDIVALTNDRREEVGASELSIDELLELSAQRKAEDMALKSYFAHVGPDGRQPWSWIADAGYAYRYAGENLAVRFVDSSDVIEAWMASPTHRANIIKPVYTHIGVGTAEGLYKGERATFVVQHFAAPMPGVAAAAANPTAGSVLDEIERFFMRVVSEPRASAALALGAVVGILALVTLFSFAMHYQIQAKDMLAGGAIVSGIALMLLVLNSTALPPTDISQSAAVFEALEESPAPLELEEPTEPVVTTEAAAVEL